MRLKSIQITDFQSIRDSNKFDIGDITCLVGKNESGKTAILKAIYRINPAIEEHADFDVTDDFPRWDVADYKIKSQKGEIPIAIVVRAIFTLENEELNVSNEMIGEKGLTSNELRISKNYDNRLLIGLDINEKEIYKNLANKYSLTKDVEEILENNDTYLKISELLNADTIEKTQDVQEILNILKEVENNKGWSLYLYNTIFEDYLPKFLYFDEYYQMRGCENIQKLLQRKSEGKSKESDYPLLGLISRARLDLNDLTSTDRTRELKNSLEGAGNHITKQIINYWSQNKYLELRFDIRPGKPNDPEGMREGTNIWCEVFDQKHRVTTELGTRSKGFVWFFSFLSWYSDYLETNKNVILLLDEPGLSLHGKAQQDLLFYFEAEIKGKHQLIYTTHSPFMVDVNNFDRIRIVQDRSIEDEVPREEEGTKVITEVLEATDDSLFPLQGALGYEIYQTLFIGPNSLVVEGVSDLLYLQTISSILEAMGRTGLDSKWVITPVGGSDKVPTFVALIGAQTELNIAVLIDYQRKDKQSIENLYKRKLLAKNKVVTYSEFTEKDEADIEDLFSEEFFIKLVNMEYESSLQKPIPLDILSKDMRILKSIEKYFEENPLKDCSFNHFRPARRLTEEVANGLEIPENTLDKYEQLFKRVNGLLKNNKK